jgi:hypothetical protein
VAAAAEQIVKIHFIISTVEVHVPKDLMTMDFRSPNMWDLRSKERLYRTSQDFGQVRIYLARV